MTDRFNKEDYTQRVGSLTPPIPLTDGIELGAADAARVKQAVCDVSK